MLMIFNIIEERMIPSNSHEEIREPNRELNESIERLEQKSDIQNTKLDMGLQLTNESYAKMVDTLEQLNTTLQMSLQTSNESYAELLQMNKKLQEDVEKLKHQNTKLEMTLQISNLSYADQQNSKLDQIFLIKEIIILKN